MNKLQLTLAAITSLALTSTAIAAEDTGAATFEATVVSTLNTDTYTYVEISKNDQKTWIVGPLVAVKPGNRVHFSEGMIMTQFRSEQLKRIFPEVMFVQEIVVTGTK
jgi:hypothetical protein